jgi:hypothetical protein
LASKRKSQHGGGGSAGGGGGGGDDLYETHAGGQGQGQGVSDLYAVTAVSSGNVPAPTVVGAGKEHSTRHLVELNNSDDELYC